MGRRSAIRLFAGTALVAGAVFVGLTIAVSSGPPLGLDTRAFQIANDLRAGWLDQVARTVTHLGLFAIVGPVVALGGVFLFLRGHQARAVAVVLGLGLTWVATQITKSAIDRSRPPAPLVHTTGASYPSGHAANSVGWLALAVALSVVLPTRGWRVFAIAAGALIAALVGVSRIYLRAHYASDVLGGEALAITVYSLAALAALAWSARHPAEATASRPRDASPS
jgi:membrane-associated phospholipid phosphatase